MTKPKPKEEPAAELDQRAKDRAAELERQRAITDAVAKHDRAELARLAKEVEA